MLDASYLVKSLLSVQVDNGNGNWQLKPFHDKHFKNYHLFMNTDFTYSGHFFQGDWLHQTKQLQPYHRVHIFLSRTNDSLENGAFLDFVKKASVVTRKPVIIHIQKRWKWLLDTVSEQLKNFREVDKDNNWSYKIIAERDSVVTEFRYDDPHFMYCGKSITDPKYLAVYWEGSFARVCCEPFTKSNTKTNEDINNG